MTLASLIKASRQERGLSLEALGEKVGACKSYICDLENGKRTNPGLVLAYDLSRVLRVPLKQMASLASRE